MLFHFQFLALVSTCDTTQEIFSRTLGFLPHTACSQLWNLPLLSWRCSTPIKQKENSDIKASFHSSIFSAVHAMAGQLRSLNVEKKFSDHLKFKWGGLSRRKWSILTETEISQLGWRDIFLGNFLGGYLVSTITGKWNGSSRNLFGLFFFFFPEPIKEMFPL